MEPDFANQPTEATGEFVAGKKPDRAGDRTGEYVPDSTDATVEMPSKTPDGATGEYVAEDAPKPDVTGEYIPTADDPPAATGEYIPGQPDKGAEGGATGAYVPGAQAAEADFNYATGRRAANLTGAASAGAFPTQARPGRIGRYFIKKVAGKGGMGEVLLAEDSDIGRPVALKRMLKGRDDQKERFWQEAQVTGQLEHPGVVPVHDLALDEKGQPYYVMKFVHGRTLLDVIKEYHQTTATPFEDSGRATEDSGRATEDSGRATEDSGRATEDSGRATEAKEVRQLRLLNIFLNLCQTIAFAHSRGVIHRDIKPDNVMVGAFGETLVLDWGLAKVIGKPEDPSDPFAQFTLSGSFDSLASIAGSIKGTPTYFAPEVAAGKVSEVDKASDIYLLGATLYHILTGRPPRQAGKLKELLELARTKEPDPPRKIKPDVLKPLDAICSKAMARAKKDRYASATEMAEEMQRYLAGEPVSAYRETLVERSWRWIKKHRTALGRTVAALLVVGVALFGYVKIEEVRQEAERQRLEDQAKFEETAAEARELAQQAKAREQIKRFHALADEMRYIAANADQVADNALVLDIARAEAKGKEALAVADLWGKDVDDMPLAAERNVLKPALYDLLLELAQIKSLQGGAGSAREMLVLLARAEPLRPVTKSFYRLRAHGLKALEQGDNGAADAKHAEDVQIASTALDHYLAGQNLRRQASRADATPPEKKGALSQRQETLTRALGEYRKALVLDPEHYWSHYQQGSTLMALRQEAEAVEVFGTCVALRSKTPWGYSARATALVSLNCYVEALDDLNQALKLDPEFRPLRLNRALVYAADKKDREALADFALALAPPEDKRFPEALFARGKFYLDRQDYDKALADFDEVVTQKLPVRAVYLHRARIYLVKGKGEQCLENMTAFLNDGQPADANDPLIHEKVGREMRLLAGELDAANPANRKLRELAYKLALGQLDRARKLGSQSPVLYGEIGAVEELLAGLVAARDRKDAAHRVRESLAAYSKALELSPKDVKVLNKRGWLHVNTSDNSKGRDDFAAALAIDPANAEAHTGLGYTQALLKAPADARRHATLALLHGAGDYLILHNVACIYAALSDKEAKQMSEYQNLTLDQLERALELWVKGGKTGPHEGNLIHNESAFPPALRNRPEFKRLMKQAD